MKSYKNRDCAAKACARQLETRCDKQFAWAAEKLGWIRPETEHWMEGAWRVLSLPEIAALAVETLQKD